MQTPTGYILYTIQTARIDDPLHISFVDGSRKALLFLEDKGHGKNPGLFLNSEKRHEKNQVQGIELLIANDHIVLSVKTELSEGEQEIQQISLDLPPNIRPRPIGHTVMNIRSLPATRSKTTGKLPVNGRFIISKQQVSGHGSSAIEKGLL